VKNWYRRLKISKAVNNCINKMYTLINSLFEKENDKMEEYKEQIREFLKKTKKVDMLNDDDDLFKKGFVNSVFALQLVNFIEKNFKIKLKNKDITEENFRSINNIINTVSKTMNK
jgi:acyl carrier protein